jgi:hypothetical protein
MCLQFTIHRFVQRCTPQVARAGVYYGKTLRAVVQGILWTASHLLYFATVFLIAVIWRARRWSRLRHAPQATRKA